MIGSDKLDQFICCYPTYLLILFTLDIDPSSLVFVHSYKDSLDIIFYSRTNDIPMPPVSINAFVPRIPHLSTRVLIHVINDLCH